MSSMAVISSSGRKVASIRRTNPKNVITTPLGPWDRNFRKLAFILNQGKQIREPTPSISFPYMKNGRNSNAKELKYALWRSSCLGGPWGWLCRLVPTPCLQRNALHRTTVLISRLMTRSARFQSRNSLSSPLGEPYKNWPWHLVSVVKKRFKWL